MCSYANIKEGLCSINNKICPYLYFCRKANCYKASVSMPINCKVKEKLQIPKGYYEVCFERKKNLYIDINGKIEIIENPFDEVPLYVKATKLKNGKWRLKKYEG